MPPNDMPPNIARAIEAYLSDFLRAARRRSIKKADEIAQDVRSHIQEALTAGEDWALVRGKLGDPESLARAYAAELIFGDRAAASHTPSLAAFLALATGGGVLSLLVTTLLGSFCLAFGLSAVLLFGLCLPIALGAPTPPYVHLSGVSPWAMVALSPVFGAIAWASGKGLAAYLRWFAGSLRRALPTRAA